VNKIVPHTSWHFRGRLSTSNHVESYPQDGAKPAVSATSAFCCLCSRGAGGVNSATQGHILQKRIFVVASMSSKRPCACFWPCACFKHHATCPSNGLRSAFKVTQLIFYIRDMRMEVRGKPTFQQGGSEWCTRWVPRWL
jgi:hypothetical protein